MVAMSRISVTLNLGTIRVSSTANKGKGKDNDKHANLSLTLSSSCSIALPILPPGHGNSDGFKFCPTDETPTPDDLRRASMAGALWIAKAGSCRVDVETRFNGQVPDEGVVDPGILKCVADSVGGLSVWLRTGLELRANHGAENGHDNDAGATDKSNASASYFLHHPDLSSEMIAPEGVPMALFEGLRCEVDYRFGNVKKRVSAKTLGQGKTLRVSRLGVEKSRDSHGGQGCHHTHIRRSKRIRGKKATVVHDATYDDAASGKTSTPASLPLSGHYGAEEEDLELLVSDAITDMASLLDFAFRKLIGLKGASPGFKTLKNTASVSLIEVAPAVWNLQYLHTMSIHARVIPSISSGIARLCHARSASLRAKLEALRSRHSRDDGSQLSSSTERPSLGNEVQRRLWRICQTRIPPDTAKGPSVPTKAKQRTTGQPESLHFFTEHDWGQLPHHFDGFSEYHLVAGEYGTFADDEQELNLPESLSSTIYANQNHIQEDEASILEDEGPSEGMQSSEGDYFYTDGQGNVYEIDKPAVHEDESVAEWPSTPQLGFDVLEQEDVEDFEEEFEEFEESDDGAEETYIMYDEVEHWAPIQGAQFPQENTLTHSFPPPSFPYPTNSIPIDWTGD
ncbi:hypothetical protein VTJ49DRAFT_1319 [Mycothermus thermophilus]|uniref:Uncharacterized protein n=1 Tax=Humicola insolens TaxID=85995 RepID=A0ABR3VCY7_HUMIN